MELCDREVPLGQFVMIFLNWANNLIQTAEVISSRGEKAPEEEQCAWLHVGASSKGVLIAMFFLGV